MVNFFYDSKGDGSYLIFWCPGCKTHHAFNNTWNLTWENGKPTVSPSLLVTAPGNNEYRCHSFIKNGQIQFLNDGSHDLKGITIDMEAHRVN